MINKLMIENTATDISLFTCCFQLFGCNFQYGTYFIGHKHKIDVAYRT